MNKMQQSSAKFPVVESSLAALRLRTIAVLYVAYGFYYLPRKSDSIVKASLREELGFTVSDLAMSDTMYLMVYTGMLLVSGMVGSKVSSNKMLCGGLCGIALVSTLKGMTSSPFVYAFLQGCHAVCQSTGWPTCIKLLANWIDGDRGFVMGVWTTCQSLGGILGALGATMALGYSWRVAYYYHVPLLVGWGFVCLFVVNDHPPKHNTDAEIERMETETSHNSETQTAPTKKPSLASVMRLPGVILVACAYFFLKFLRYALLFWLPFYYHEGLNYEQAMAGYISTSFEFGGLVGTPFIGWLSDKYLGGKRDVTSAMFMCGAAGMLFLSNATSALGVGFNSVTMFLIGILVIGPDSVLSGTIAQDIGQKSPMGPAVIGTLAGLINSVGSCGSIFQSYATAMITSTFGWSTLFMVFVACASCSSAILFRVSFQNDTTLKAKIWKFLDEFFSSPRNIVVVAATLTWLLFVSIVSR